SYKSDVHPRDAVHLVDIDFGENDLLGAAEVVISSSIKTFRVYAVKIAYSWKGSGHQPIQKFIHLFSTQGNFGTNRHSFTKLERSHVFFGNSRYCLLACDDGKLFHSMVYKLFVGNSSANPTAHNYFGELGYFHYIPIAEFFGQRRDCFFSVFLLKSWYVTHFF